MFNKKIERRYWWWLFSLVILIFIIFTGFRHNSFEISNITEPVLVKIEKGDTLSQISLKLEERGIIKNPWVFKIRAIFTGKALNLKPGYYEFQKNEPFSDLISALSNGLTSSNYNLTIKEGMTLKEVEKILKSKGFIDDSETFSQWKLTDFKDYLRGLPLKESDFNASLEGFLWPATYQLIPGDSFYNLTALMIKNFNSQIQNHFKEQIQNNPRDFYSNLIMASILEKELTDIGDKKIASGLLWKRLEHNMKLQIDATVCYAKNESFDNCHNLKAADLNFDSIYNTYLYKGLPPTPICNPGLSSLEAALEPQASDYWYYLTDPQTKKAIFSRTLVEHNLAIQKYLKNNF